MYSHAPRYNALISKVLPNRTEMKIPPFVQLNNVHIPENLLLLKPWNEGRPRYQFLHIQLVLEGHTIQCKKSALHW